MISSRFVNILIIIFCVFLLYARAQGQNTCESYCRDGIFYSGNYDGRAGVCSFTSTRCEYSCNAEGTNCASSSNFSPVFTPTPTPNQEETDRSCLDYCSGNIRYYRGVYNSETKACEYQTERCEYGCNGEELECVERAVEQENIQDEGRQREESQEREESKLTEERTDENLAREIREKELKELEETRKETRISPTVTVEVAKSA